MNNKINHEDLAEARQPELAAGQISMVLLAEQVEEEIKGSTESGESVWRRESDMLWVWSPDFSIFVTHWPYSLGRTQPLWASVPLCAK